MLELVDSHCHLNFPDFKEDLDQVILRASQAGVKYMQTICTSIGEFPEVLAVAERFSNIFCSVGVHPNESGVTDKVTAEELVRLSSHPKVIGLGETGLDYYYEHSDRISQQTSFRAHIEAAQITGLPIIVHTRNADADTIEMLTSAYKHKPFTGVIHCFTSSMELAEKMLEIGFYISFSGIITFKNAADIRDVAKIVPLERILVETDSPYLAPMPYRGKRNEPSYVYKINNLIAQLKQINEIKIAEITTANFFCLFNKITPAFDPV